jgi:hypothetical protein
MEAARVMEAETTVEVTESKAALEVMEIIVSPISIIVRVAVVATKIAAGVWSYIRGIE